MHTRRRKQAFTLFSKLSKQNNHGSPWFNPFLPNWYYNTFLDNGKKIFCPDCKYWIKLQSLLGKVWLDRYFQKDRNGFAQTNKSLGNETNWSII